MRILFDASVPAPLGRRLKGHEVTLSPELKWQGLKNGVLLDAAERTGFDVLVTCDQSIRYQQNFTDRKLAVVILSTNRWRSLLPVAAKIATAIDFAQRGQVVRVDIAEL